MGIDFDWIVEHETLPPEDAGDSDEVDYGRPGGPARPDLVSTRPKRRPPRWQWAILIALACAGGVLLYLWLVGGDAAPLPGPDRPADRLNTAVQMEIGALHTRDLEIFDRMQDTLSYRQDLQPPPDRWFAADDDTLRSLVVRDVEVIDEESAQAAVEFTWNGVDYGLTWFYRRDGERWVHTDWRQPEIEELAQLESAHLRLLFPPLQRDQATLLQDELEAMIADLCRLIECRGLPFTSTLRLDPYYASYYAEAESDGTYRLPAPFRIRWPMDRSPEPLVLASAGRHLAYELAVAPAWRELSGPNRAALGLSALWLVHHLLDSELLPSTRWLETAAHLDGLEAAAAYIRGVAQGIDPQAALRVAFRPETVAAVTAMADYFGWLVMIIDTDQAVSGSIDGGTRMPYPWARRFLVHVDEQADPWAAAGRAFDAIVPLVTRAVIQDGWAVVTATGASGDGNTAFVFELREGSWAPADLEASPLAQPRSLTYRQLNVWYRGWDEPYLDAIVATAERAIKSTSENWGIQLRGPVTLAVLSPGSAVEPSPADIYVTSPLLIDDLSANPGADYLPTIAVDVTGYLFGQWVQDANLPDERVVMVIGALVWQAEQAGLDRLDFFSRIFDTDLVLGWIPPPHASSPDWPSLERSWLLTSSATDDPADLVTLFVFPVYVVDYIVEQYGVDRLPDALDAIRTAATYEEWVLLLTGQSMEAFELEWRAWMIDRYPDRPNSLK